jgi:hypothetical protein
MEKINRLGWAAGFAFVSHGVRIGIRANDAQALERAANHLPPGSEPCSSPVVNELCSLLVARERPASNIRRYNLLYWEASRVARTMIVDEVFQKLEAYLHLIVALESRQRVFVRAAVAVWEDTAILVLGPRSSGKTMLLDALLRAGATYYSDRYAVLDRRGRVYPYPTAFPEDRGQRAEDSESGQRTEDSQTGPLSSVLYPLSSTPRASGPLPVGLVVDTRYKSGVRFRPRLLSPGETLCSLLTNTVSARSRPKAALASLQWVANGARAFRGKRGEAADAAGALLRKLDSERLVDQS